MDKWIGAMMLVIILAMVTAGSFVVYNIFSSDPQGKDTYGNQFNNRTNATARVETAIAPVSINIMGYVTLISVIFVIVGAGVLVAKSVGVGGGSRGMR